MNNYLILLSGGIGSRMKSNIPKQYLEVNGKSILSYTLSSFDFSIFKKIIIVLADEWKDFVSDEISKYFSSDKIDFARAGESRQSSILNGLLQIKDLAAADDIVVIHDGVRPFVTQKLVNELIEANKSFDGVMPVIPVKDTIYCSKNGKEISGLLNRNELYSGQAPESFKFGKYFAINIKLSKDQLDEIKGSSEIAFKNNLSVGLIEGDEGNFKITTLADLERFKEIINRGN